MASVTTTHFSLVLKDGKLFFFFLKKAYTCLGYTYLLKSLSSFSLKA